MITAAETSRSARQAIALGILREGDRIVMNRDLVLADAFRHALTLRDEGYVPPAKETIGLAGAAGFDLLRRQREALLALASRPETRERARHLLATGKHLRN